METNIWYPDNRVSNHMTRDRSKFKKLDKKFIGNMKFCDRLIVLILGR